LNAIRSSKDQRQGVIYLQSLLVMMVMILLTIALLQWTFVMTSHQAVNAATGEGARVAARANFAGSTQQTVTEAAVREVLAANGMEAADATVLIVDGGSSVSVEVHMPFGSAKVPDWLSAFGLSMSGYEFQTSAIGWK